MIIDSHHHYWRTAAQEQPWRTTEHRLLERDFSPTDLDPELDAAGVDGTVLIQSVDESAENDRLASYAEHPRVAGVVAWLPLREPVAAAAELERITIPTLVGVRCLVAREPLDWLADASVQRLLKEVASRGLVWDVVPVTQPQVDAVLATARALPELRIVIDHLGRPPVDSPDLSAWRQRIAALASEPNIAMKASVGIDALTAWDSWDRSVLAPFTDTVLEAFTAQRVMLASNWPVVLLKADYQTAWSDLQALMAQHLGDGHELDAVLGGTATNWYGLTQETQT